MINRIEGVLFSPDPRVAWPGRVGLIFAGALVASLLVASGGPLYG